MTLFKFRCPACETEDVVSRAKPPKHCPECGSPIKDLKEIKPTHTEKTPPKEPDEEEIEDLQVAEDLERVGKDHEAGHACKYGCIPPTTKKCESCPEEKCDERVAKYKHHWKRRKAVKVIKSIVGKEVSDLVSDKDLWKTLARERVGKLLDALGFEGKDKDEALTDVEHVIDRFHEKAKRKLR